MKKDKSVSMATTMPSNKINSSEDHMDLGPFLQEYVLRNPFNPMIEPPRVPPPPPPRVPSRDSNHDNGVVVPQKTEKGSPEKTLVGHIGSNVGYAHQLKQLRLPRRHNKVRQWLLQHYRYASFYSGWVSSDALLKEVKGPFSDMKSSVLSRIMKFTYPECRKVINRYGYFYMGLIKRPTVLDFNKENLQRAAQDVNKDTNNISSVAVKHKVDSFKLASVYVWLKDGPMEENATPSKRGRRSTANVNYEESSDKDEDSGDWQPEEEDAIENVKSNENTDGKPLPRLRSLRKRTRNAVLGYLRAKLQPLEGGHGEGDTSDDNEPISKKRKNSKSARQSKSRESLKSFKSSSETTHNAAPNNNSQNGGHGEFATSGKEASGSESEPAIRIGEVVTVKQEPSDNYLSYKSMTDSDDSNTAFSGHNTSDEIECEAIDMSTKKLIKEENGNNHKAPNANIHNIHNIHNVSNVNVHNIQTNNCNDPFVKLEKCQVPLSQSSQISSRVSQVYTSHNSNDSNSSTPTDVQNNLPSDLRNNFSNHFSRRSPGSPKEALDSLVGRLRASLTKEPEPEPQVIAPCSQSAPSAANIDNPHNHTANNVYSANNVSNLNNVNNTNGPHGANGAQANNGKVNDVNVIAESLKCRQELDIVRKDLAIREEENYQLQQDLRSSRQELQELKEKLTIQNSLFSDLSREFYDLSNHFMKVSHNFKTVLTEVQRSTEKLT